MNRPHIIFKKSQITAGMYILHPGGILAWVEKYSFYYYFDNFSNISLNFSKEKQIFKNKITYIVEKDKSKGKKFRTLRASIFTTISP